MPLLRVIAYKYDETANDSPHAAIVNPCESIAYSIAEAHKNPIGVFESNGNLSAMGKSIRLISFDVLIERE